MPVTATTPGIQLKPGGQPRLAAGSWRADPAHSHASFTARVAGRDVQGHLPLTGEVRITEPIEDSTARLSARTSAVSTGSPVLDRLLAGPGFLDARAFPEISFQSELLVWVPAGWRAVGRLRVKNAEHELACQLSLHPAGLWPGGRRIIIAGTWAIDSRWVTSQWIPGLGRRIVMTCSCLLELGM
jgi:polyisoprenoid-binding protein YceI